MPFSTLIASVAGRTQVDRKGRSVTFMDDLWLVVMGLAMLRLLCRLQNQK